MPSPEAIALGAAGATGGAFLGACAKALVDRWARRGFDAVDGYPELARVVKSLEDTTKKLGESVSTLTRRCDQLEHERTSAERERDEARRERDEMHAQLLEVREYSARLDERMTALQEAVNRGADSTDTKLARMLELLQRQAEEPRRALPGGRR